MRAETVNSKIFGSFHRFCVEGLSAIIRAKNYASEMILSRTSHFPEPKITRRPQKKKTDGIERNSMSCKPNYTIYLWYIRI